MNAVPSATSFGLLLGLSFFLGLAFEEFFAQSATRRPGGIRTFPLLALAGGMLYLFDPVRLVPFTGGLLVLGAWLAIFYLAHIREHDDQGEPTVAIVVLVLNVHAFLLGAITLALPHWVAVGTTVAAVLLLTGREQLHDLARRVEMKEIVTAGQFLILTGLVLPLLPNEPVTTLTSITPRQAWLALLVVCSLSYASYLAQRYWAAAALGLWMAALGGLYSSTATTVVLARQAASDPALRQQAQAGITLATGIMYLRILVIVAVFNLALARRLAVPLLGLSVVAMLIAAIQYWTRTPSAGTERKPVSQNPLELGAAAVFAAFFVITSLLSNWAKAKFGVAGIYALAAVVGITDIDPFVLNLAQGGTTDIPVDAVAAAILIAASSNNLLKAGYAASFAGRATAASAATLIGLAVLGVGAAMAVGGIWTYL
ncbi:MAG TPA: DUF4010 domain-containing protein [Xanthobacteraceae bacterium]|jgi:uncharacterized membrane protein (DUF4010 family)